MEEAEEVQGRGRLHLPVQLLHDDPLHPHHVRHRETVLGDADEVVGQRHVPLLLRGLNGDVEATEAHAGQVLGLDLRQGTRRPSLELNHDVC